MCKEFIEDKVRIITIMQFCYRYLLYKITSLLRLIQIVYLKNK